MTYRNRKLLDEAHGMPCTAQFEHRCTQHMGCEPAHSDSQLFGRGHSHKSHDWAFAAMCHEAHTMIGNRVGQSMSKEQRFMEWLRAYVATQTWLWENRRVRVS